MTSPVVMPQPSSSPESISMTAPVVQSGKPYLPPSPSCPARGARHSDTHMSLLRNNPLSPIPPLPPSLPPPLPPQIGNTMQFIMPSSYTSLSSLPQPTDPRVHLKEVPGKTVGVIRYRYALPPSLPPSLPPFPSFLPSLPPSLLHHLLQLVEPVVLPARRARHSDTHISLLPEKIFS